MHDGEESHTDQGVVLRSGGFGGGMGESMARSCIATLVFSTMVVSVPMILDRDTDALTAGITSMRVVVENTGVMLLWGALITLLVVGSLALWGVGLLLVGPLLGHASWHAYRAAVIPLQRTPAGA